MIVIADMVWGATDTLYAAGRADDADLRAHVIADFASQYNFLGYPKDCLSVVRQGEVDERVGHAVRMVLYTVKARAYAARGEAEACQRHIELAEDAHTTATDCHGWLASVATPAQLFAGTGQAAALLARRTGSETDRADAQRRLTRAIAELDPARQARAIGLCLAQLTILNLETGQRDEAASRGTQLLQSATDIRSARLAEQLATVRKTAQRHTDDPAIKQLITDLDDLLEGARS